MKNILSVIALAVMMSLCATSAFAQNRGERGRVVVREGRNFNQGYVRGGYRDYRVGGYVSEIPDFVTVWDLNTDCYVQVPYFAGYYSGYRMYVGGRRGRGFVGGNGFVGGRANGGRFVGRR